MKSKILSLLFSSVLMLSFTACSEDEVISGAGGSLTVNEVYADSIVAGETGLYTFQGIAGSKYLIKWDDDFSGSGAYTADIKVSALKADGTYYTYATDSAYTPYTIFQNVDSGYISEHWITVTSDETVTIKVIGYTTSEEGSFSIEAISQ